MKHKYISKTICNGLVYKFQMVRQNNIRLVIKGFNININVISPLVITVQNKYTRI